MEYKELNKKEQIEQSEQIKKPIENDKKKKIKNIGEISYCSKKVFQKIYPMGNVGYRIVGFIGDGVSEKPIDKWMYQGEVQNYYSFKKKKRFYEIIGYVEKEEDTYIAIIQRKVLKKILPLLLLLLIMFLLIFYFVCIPKGPDLEDGMGKYMPDTGVSRNEDSTSIILPGYKDINMEANTDTAYVALYNPEGNPCYFRFKITLSKTGETIYESKLIPPGFAVTNVKFDRTFKRGVYPLSIRIETSSLNDHTEKMNGGDIKTRLVAIEK